MEVVKHLGVWFRLVCEWTSQVVHEYEHPYMYKLEHMRRRGPNTAQNRSIAQSKIDTLIDRFWTTDISLLDVVH